MQGWQFNSEALRMKEMVSTRELLTAQPRPTDMYQCDDEHRLMTKCIAVQSVPHNSRRTLCQYQLWSHITSAFPASASTWSSSFHARSARLPDNICPRDGSVFDCTRERFQGHVWRCSLWPPFGQNPVVTDVNLRDR